MTYNKPNTTCEWKMEESCAETLLDKETGIMLQQYLIQESCAESLLDEEKGNGSFLNHLFTLTTTTLTLWFIHNNRSLKDVHTTKKMMPTEGDNPLSLRVTVTITTEFTSTCLIAHKTTLADVTKLISPGYQNFLTPTPKVG